jgi:hypothetical protein
MAAHQVPNRSSISSLLWIVVQRNGRAWLAMVLLLHSSSNGQSVHRRHLVGDRDSEITRPFNSSATFLQFFNKVG